jgi:hypothetical protein
MYEVTHTVGDLAAFVFRIKLETVGSADALVTINEATRCHKPQRHSNKYRMIKMSLCI